MSRRGHDLLARALELPVPERARLARELLDSLDEEHLGELHLDPAYGAELLRRAADEPAPGQRWPTAAEAVSRIRAGLEKPVRKPRRPRRGA